MCHADVHEIEFHWVFPRETIINAKLDTPNSGK